MPTYESYIAGVKFRKGAQDVLDRLDAEAVFTLEPEPSNRFDPSAVKVLSQGVHVGYVPRHTAALVGKAITDDRLVKVTRRGSGAGIDITYREKA